MSPSSPSFQGSLPHPENPDAPDVVPTPMLLVATTDGILRFFCFGHLKRQQVLTVAPEPVPLQLPAELSKALAEAGETEKPSAAAAGPSTAEAAAAKAALPDDDDDDFGSEEEEDGGAVPALGPAAQAPAAPAEAAGSSSSELKPTAEVVSPTPADVSLGGLTPVLPASVTPVSGFPMPAIATSSLAPSAGAPAFGFAPAALGAMPSLFGTSSSAPAFGFSAALASAPTSFGALPASSPALSFASSAAPQGGGAIRSFCGSGSRTRFYAGVRSFWPRR
jgi:nuclear pore complex protein Nup214